MNIQHKIEQSIRYTIEKLYGQPIKPQQISVQRTKKEFEGDFTFVVFPFISLSKKNPEQTGQEIGEKFCELHKDIVEKYNVVKGFLNITLQQGFWLNFLLHLKEDQNYGYKSSTSESPTIMVEFSSPNTNKPLHLGHIRNNVLGHAISNILEAAGNKVIKVTLVNDRGIHICKSMLAWLNFGNGETPTSSNKKGDHLVGDYYVKFEQEYKKEVALLQQKQGITLEEAKKQSKLMCEVKDMLIRWENRDPETIELWKTMNQWVYGGFEKTYQKLGIEFDHVYYESNTYLLGKKIIEDGLKQNVFFKEHDNSIWIDLTKDGLDRKLVQRSDGTSVYITQDIGTIYERFQSFNLTEHIYVVGNEQIYHFQVLKKILKALQFPWADHIFHLSYGMVELPHGKMKSREGTVVDADELLDEMHRQAVEISIQQGKLDDLTEIEKKEVQEKISLAALKYFILKVDPLKTMLFDPKESIDFNGNTGPFIQYTCARIQSVIKKSKTNPCDLTLSTNINLQPQEKELLAILSTFPQIIENAAQNLSPAIIANYCYELAKEYNRFYHDLSILNEPNEIIRNLRLILSNAVLQTLKKSFALLGMGIPNKM